MKTKLILSFLSLLLLTSHLLLGTIRYVSKTGTSTPPYTSWATASDSIQKCINICQNGDTLYVANGVYKETLIVNKQIALIGSSMDSTVIDGRGLANFTVTFNSSGIINNFKIRGKDQLSWNNKAIWAPAQFTNIAINNCQISETGWGVSSVDTDLSVENILMNEIRGGFSLASAVNQFTYNISDCVISLSSSDATGIQIGFAENATAYINNNIIIFNHPFNNPNNGIYLDLPKKVYINNNLISGFDCNIKVDGFFDTAFIKNNVLVCQEASGATGGIYNSGGIIVMKNNILSNNYIGLSTPSIWPWRVTSGHNIFWQNAINISGINYGDSDRAVDPMFVNDSAQSSNFDFHLQAYSPAIDKGDPSILDIDGTRSDIGMYGGPLGEAYTYNDLAPKPPRNISAVVDSNSTRIRWNRNSEADTAFYKVYRDTVQSFILDSSKVVSTTADTFYVHGTFREENKYYYYKVTCVDKHGHESVPSEEIVIRISSINDYRITVNDYYLYQNYPNPFNPSTSIGYKLKERGYVKVMVYDINGELISVLVNQEQEAGYYEVEFDKAIKEKRLSSGIYLYRIEVIGDGNIPVFTNMKKMLMVK